jgi:uncharacterized protein (TIGR00369 family)
MPPTPPAADETQDFKERMPFASTLGLTDVTATPEVVTGSLAWAPRLCNPSGVLHGGVLMSLADSVAGYCAFLNLPDGAGGTTTIESKTNFLRPVRSGTVRATARPLHVGRQVIVIDTELRDDTGRLVARTTR